MDAWTALVAHIAVGSGRAWWTTRDRLLAGLGEQAFGARLSELLESADAAPQPLLELAAQVAPDDRLSSALGSRAERAYRRIPNQGPADRRTGNLCIKALAAYGTRGAPELERLARVIKYPSGRERVEAALDAIATAHGVSRAELDELTVPDHGLDTPGRLEARADTATAVLRLDEDGETHLVWRTATGRHQKTAPAPVRRSSPDAVADVLALERRVRREVRSQALRLEQLLREGRSWSFTAWSVRYAEHPIVAPLARRLIWRFDRADDTVEAIFHEGHWVGYDGAPVSGLAASRVTLWHPAEASPRRRAAWRSFVEGAGIRQPFRQADREVFLRALEDGPDPRRCMRFAGRVVRPAAVRGARTPAVVGVHTPRAVPQLRLRAAAAAVGRPRVVAKVGGPWREPLRSLDLGRERDVPLADAGGEELEAGDPVELVSADGPPGGAHAAVPRLAAGDQRGQLQQRRSGDRHQRDGCKRVRRRPFPAQREGEKPEAGEGPNHNQPGATPKAGLGQDGASARIGAPWVRTRRRSPTFWCRATRSGSGSPRATS
jgi:hypothetical protein